MQDTKKSMTEEASQKIAAEHRRKKMALLISRLKRNTYHIKVKALTTNMQQTVMQQ